MRTRSLKAICFAVPAVALGAASALGTSATSHAIAGCDPSALATLRAETLTIGTDNPAYPPWFGGGERAKPWKINDPATGKGYESAVAYALASELGFSRTSVRWGVTPFLRSFAPGKKPFDIFINQVSIKAERAKNVTFSASYYNATQAVVVLKGAPIASVGTVAGLKRYRFGASIGTTSYDTIVGRIRPTAKPSVFDTNDNAITALKNRQIDGVLVDLPTAYYITSAQIPSARILGQFAASGKDERFGVVLAKGSPLAPCVNRAVAKLRKDGTLKRLERRWLAGPAAPFLK
ncbi:MAG: amino acid ABC transporter substrate-binding protein [Actinobacteria bacterium]|nr:amino acid ABC transporter substrate-binding protein [Actinomycetota bacterium]